MSAIIELTTDNEIMIMPELEVNTAYDTYMQMLGEFPRPEEDATPEQLS